MRPTIEREKNEATSANGKDTGKKGVLILTLCGALILVASFILYNRGN